MKKIYLTILTALLLITSFSFGVDAKSSTTIAKNSPSLEVNTIYSNNTKVTGNATKGSLITVRTKTKKTLAKTYADKQTGKFSLSLPSKQKAYTQLYVYAKKTNSKAYFYRIIHVQKAKTTSEKNKKSQKENKSKSIEGVWNSSFDGNNQSQRLIFNNQKGMSLQVLKNGKLISTKFSQATYNLKIGKKDFSSIKYRLKGIKKIYTTYVRFTSNKSFILVNSNNKLLEKGFYNSNFTQFTK